MSPTIRLTPLIGPVLLALTVGNALGQQPSDEIRSLRQEIQLLHTEQKQLRMDLQLIKSMLLGKQVTPEAAPLTDTAIGITGAASLGSPKAKVVVVEFSDYQCPFCGRYATETLPALVRDYVNTGKIQYIFRNFPLREAHPLAQIAAEAAECAGEQGRYWEAHERLFRTQQTLGSNPLMDAAASLGLDEQKFRRCLNGGKAAITVQTDLTEGAKIGVDATPTFYFGLRDDTDGKKIRAVKRLTGAQPLVSFAQILEYLLDPPPSDGGNR